MPYEITWTDKGAEVQFSGVFDFKVNKEVNCKIYQDPRCEEMEYVIWDTSNISELTLTEEELTILAQQDQLGSARLLKLKLAILATNQETYTLFEYYANSYYTRLTGWSVRVFNDASMLKDWI